jgi:tetratricopeptide (TPR) repeat protein
VLLDKAQDLSGKTVHAFKEKEFLADLKREYAKAKIERPDDAHLLRSYRNTRAALLGTLGRIYLAQGRTDRAAKIFAEAERNEPTAVAAAGLGTLAYAAGREDAAYDYFLRARLTGALSAADDRTFEALFAKRHGTDASPERTLDDAYRSRYANPIHVTPYAGPPSNGRASLLEMFTGAGCPPCAGADLAVDAVRERYSPRDLVVLMHHVHIPRPDPMTNVDTVARSAFYAVQAAPTFVVDGIGMQPGGSSREDAERPFGQLTAAIEEALKEPPHARIALALSVSGRTVRVRADVTDVDGPREELMLRLALVERELTYGGENGIRFHPMVVRSLLDRPLASASGPIDAAFDLDHIAAGLRNYLDGYQRRNDRFGPIAFLAKPTAVDVANVGVVAFVQRDADRRVLQSAYMAVGTVRSER